MEEESVLVPGGCFIPGRWEAEWDTRIHGNLRYIRPRGDDDYPKEGDRNPI